MKRNSSLIYIAALSFSPAVVSAQTSWATAAPSATAYYGGALIDFTNNTSGTLELTGLFDLNLSGAGGFTNSYAVYAKNSALAGNEMDPSAWTLLGSTTATSNAQGTFTTVKVGHTFDVAAGRTIGLGFFITSPNLGMADGGFIGYASGANTYTDGATTIATGMAKHYDDGVSLFNEMTFNPRSWSGRVQYAPVATVPEPFSIGGIAAGLLGFVIRRRNRR